VSKLSITSLRVTDFKQYLQCRYRFYLDRVLGLQESADNLKELPPFAFGRLLHAAVEAFGRDAIKDSSDAQQIRRFFHRFMDREIARNPHPSAAVRIQHQQIRLRLDQLADVQAQWRGEGWQIVEVETDDLSTKLIVDGKPFGLRGRIDRVDRNETTGQLAVFDYKTSDAGTPPDKAHRRRGEWIDLQLPMYRHLIATRAYFTTSPIKMGYILTPADLKKTQFALAEWTEAELAEADEVAFNVIRRVRRNEFWPPEPEPPDYGEKWATICQDEVSERWEPQEARL
jgi:ATP-dependent helicase/DNAse subunit B